MQRNKILAILFLGIFLLPLFSVNLEVIPVAAAETEEIDEFLRLPNYRWTNATTTTNTTEKIDNGYEIYTANGDLAKYRQLNTRDLYFDGRYQFDNPNDTYLEFFRDQQDDECDFFDGDTESWLELNNATFDVSDSILAVTNEDDTNSGMELFLARIPDDAEAAYHMDTGSGTIAYDALDEHDANFGTPSGREPAWTAPGYNNYGYCLDFEEDNDSYMVVDDHDDLSFDGDVPFSFEVWVNLEDGGDVQSILNKFSPSYEYRFLIDAADRAYLMCYDTSGNWIRGSGSTNLDYDTWYYIVATYDGSETKEGITIYVNGGEDSTIRSSSGTYTGMSNTASVLYIGSYSAAEFDGLMDELRIHRTELSADEILDFYEEADKNHFSTYDRVEFRASASETTTLNFTLDADIDYTNTTTITTGWDEYTLHVNYNLSNQETALYWNIIIMNASRTVYFDWIHLWGDLDYNNSVGTYTPAIPAIPQSYSFVNEYIPNADFETNNTGVYFTGSAESQNLDGWAYLSGFSGSGVHDGEIVDVSGDKMFYQDNPSGGQDAELKNDTYVNFEFNETAIYYINSTIRVHDKNAVGDGLFAAMRFLFHDGTSFLCDVYFIVQVDIHPSAIGIYDISTLNDSNTVAYYTEISQNADSSWVTWEYNLTEVFEDMTAMDSAAERANIDNLQYRLWFDDTASSETGGDENYEIWIDDFSLSEWDIIDAIPEVPGYWNYTYVTHDFTQWDERQGNKLSLMNTEEEELFWIQINNLGHSYEVSTYELQIIFLDALLRPMWNYSTTFQHHPREWFRLDFSLNLELVEMELKLSYDNGTRIGSSIDIYDIQESIEVLPAIFHDQSIPKLCINTTTSFAGHSSMAFTFIEADYDPVDWREPDFTRSSFASGYTIEQGSEAYYDTLTPYNIFIDSTDTSDEVQRWFVMDIDYFDAVSADFEINAENIEQGDKMNHYLELFSVQPDGSLLFICELELRVIRGASDFTLAWYIYKAKTASPYWLAADSWSDSVAYGNLNGSWSIGFDQSEQRITFAFGEYTSASESSVSITAGTDTNELDFGKEFVLFSSIWVDTSNGGVSGDELSFTLSGFDLVRKDILGFIGEHIIRPVGNLITWVLGGLFRTIMAPVIALLGFLATVFKAAIEVLGDIFTVLINAVLDFLDPLFTWLNDILDEFTEMITPLVQSFIDNFIEPFVQWVIDVMGTILQAILEGLLLLFTYIWDLMADFVFWVWDDVLQFGPGDANEMNVLAFLDGVISAFVNIIQYVIDFFLTIPDLIVDTIDIWIAWGWVPTAIVWFWIIYLPATTANDIWDWMDRVLARLFANLSPGRIDIPIPFLGSIPIFPSKFPLIVPLFFITVFILTGEVGLT